MKKHLIFLLAAILFVNCGNRSSNGDTTEQTEVQNSDSELVITDNCVIILFPDSLEQKEMREQFGEETYNEIISDILYYNSEAEVVLKDLGVPIVHCDKKHIKLVNSKGDAQILKKDEIDGSMIVFHKDKSPVISNVVGFDKKQILRHLDITETPHQSK